MLNTIESTILKFNSVFCWFIRIHYNVGLQVCVTISMSTTLTSNSYQSKYVWFISLRFTLGFKKKIRIVTFLPFLKAFIKIFLGNFSWQFLFTIRILARNLLIGNRRKKNFCTLFWCSDWGSNINKPTHYLLDYGDFFWILNSK